MLWRDINMPGGGYQRLRDGSWGRWRRARTGTYSLQGWHDSDRRKTGPAIADSMPDCIVMPEHCHKEHGWLLEWPWENPGLACNERHENCRRSVGGNVQAGCAMM